MELSLFALTEQYGFTKLQLVMTISKFRTLNENFVEQLPNIHNMNAYIHFLISLL